MHDFKIVDQKSKSCKQSDLDTLFVEIDATAARIQQAQLKEEVRDETLIAFSRRCHAHRILPPLPRPSLSPAAAVGPRLPFLDCSRRCDCPCAAAHSPREGR